jgi:hypothetical protein
VDSELVEKARACRRDFGSSVTEHDVFVRCGEVGCLDTEAAGEMVVADPGIA